MGAAEPWINIDSLAEQALGLLIPLSCPKADASVPAQPQVIGANVFRWPSPGQLKFLGFYASGQSGHDDLNYFILNRKDVVDLAIVALSPKMVACDGIDELCGDTHP